jgi:serine protease AprX
LSYPLQHRRGRLIAVLAAVVALLAPGASAAQAAPSARARLASVARGAPARQVVAIAQFKPGFSERRARRLVRAHHGRVATDLSLIHGLAVKLPAREARALSRSRHVVALSLNAKVHGQGVNSGQLSTTFPKTIRADKLWRLGITGRGVGVAVIDTGVAGDAADFRGADGSSRVVANVVTNAGAATAGDGYGHGTHVAGIIAGNSFNRPAGDPLHGRYVGVAPDASLIAIKASDDAGNSTVLDVIRGIAFAVDHKADFNIRVLNLSLSTDTPQSYRYDPLDAAVEYAWQHGIVVVAAAGNRGDAADAVRYAPANDPFVISVGGADETGDHGRGEKASWSSGGTTQDGFSKPEVMAPGAHMISVLAPGSAFASLCPGCVIAGQYFKAGGTSMAAPVVSGAVALLLQARPWLTPDQVKTLLMVTDHAIKGSSAGEIDVEHAVFTPAPWRPANAGVAPNALIDALDRAGIDVSRWTRSSWSTATGTLAAAWARSSWSCAGCPLPGAAVDPTRSSWSRSSWSSAGESATTADTATSGTPVTDQDDPALADATIPTDGAGR